MRKLLKTVAFLGVFGCVVLGAFSLRHFRPLVATSEWTASSSEGVRGRVLQILFDSNRIFVEFPDSINPRNRWFALDLENQIAGSPNPPKTKPYLYVNRGQEAGIDLTGMKIGTPWFINWDETKVTLVGPDFEFTLYKNGANMGRQATASPSPAT